MLVKVGLMSVVVMVVCLWCPLSATEEQIPEGYVPFGFWYKGYPKPSEPHKKVTNATSAHTNCFTA
jgi:hypothetical protein